MRLDVGRWPIVFAFWAALLCLSGGSAAFPGEPGGFGGLMWGAAKEGLGPLKHAGMDEAGTTLYEKTEDVAYFGRARLAGIEYGFRDGRLTAVTLKVDSLLQYLLLKEEAVRLYGKGDAIAGEKDSYTWGGDDRRISLVGHFTES